MPEYFFHVDLEILQASASSLGASSLQNPPLSLNRVLAPFSSPSPRQRTSNSLSARNTSILEQRKAVLDQGHPALSNGSATPPPVARRTDPKDRRLDDIWVEGMDMMRSSSGTNGDSKGGSGAENQISKGIGTSVISGLHTKGRYVPHEQRITDREWGIVHLYRDAEESPGLYGDSPLGRAPDPWSHGITKDNVAPKHAPPADKDCTMLCILAVPSYLGPSDFLGFVGEETRNEVSHFRMIRTSRANRYMVLMKFRHGKKAREWQQEWNGKVFNSMEPETCHVVFLSSVSITPSSTTSSPPTYPSTPNDPFTSTSNRSSKPLAPPTPSLVELPTCPVCLERMDETTGLLTILCQHVFHCTCLQKWSGGGCPVCRYTHDDFSSHPSSKSKFKSKSKLNSTFLQSSLFDPDDYDFYDPTTLPLECETCHATANLWQCLLCGTVGCGRYDAAHAFAHYKVTDHSFAMDLESKRVWDYAGDAYVHRIIADAGPGEKLVELPGHRGVGDTALEPGGEEDDVERDKFEALALEYTHLLTSQLESQRVYFEEQNARAADKAAEAARAAIVAREEAAQATVQLAELHKKYTTMEAETVPALARAEKRAGRFEALSREMERRFNEERTVGVGLVERVRHLDEAMKELKQEKEGLLGKVTELEEQVRDLGFFISSKEKLEGMGGELAKEVKEGVVSVPEPEQAGAVGKKKGKGKGRK